MTITTAELMRATQAKSDQLNACDILGGPLVSKILDIKAGNSDQPVLIVIDSWPQPWKPSKTSLRVLSACWGRDPQQWIGRYAVLCCDESVKWAGVAVGGVRTSHLSHIDGRKVISTNAAKGKKADQIVDPYYPQESDQPDPEPTYWPDDAFANQLKKNQAKIDSGELAIQAFIDGLQSRAMLTAGQKARIKVTPVYTEDEAAQIGSDEPPAYDGDDPFAGE